MWNRKRTQSLVLIKFRNTNAAEGVAQNDILHYSSLETD